jgi:hypothetical protein
MNKKTLSIALLCIVALSGAYFSFDKKDDQKQLFDEWAAKFGMSFDET